MPGPSATSHLRVVPLVSTAEYGPADAGSMAVYSGRPGWIFMTMKASHWKGEVHCVAVLAGGRTVPLGAFWLSGSGGAWGVPLRLPASSLRSARIVTASGQVLATGRLAPV